MFWIISIGAGLIGLLVLLLLVGLLLPAAYQFDVRQRLDAPVEHIWQLLRNPKALPVSGRQCRGVEIMSESPLSWKEDLGASQVTYTVLEEAPNEWMKWHAADSVVPMQFDAEIHLNLKGGKTVVHIAVRGSIERGTFHVPIFRWMVHLGAARAGFRNYLKRAREQAIQRSN